MKIEAKVIKGRYKDDIIDIILGRDAISTFITINDHPIENCRRIEIICDAMAPANIVKMEFVSMPREESNDNTQEQQDNT